MILLNYGDLTIKGDSMLDGYEDWVQIQSVQWGVGRAVTSTTGGGDRKFSEPSFSEISLSKEMDKGSIDLFIEACGGKKPYPAILTWVDNSGEAIEVYHSLELGNAVITSYSSSSGGDRPSDQFTLNFTTMKVLYTRFTDTGDPEEISPKGWNLTKGTKL
jgi:type VI secretion system secreted protein Hcp